ncbi:protein kinase X [Enteropsectra breve]|nr:protein kinase X [Enteropsectra breve]
MISYDDFEFHHVIGTGAFGKVFLGHYSYNNKFYALKRMDKYLLKESRQLDNVQNEANIMQQINCCPFVVKLFHALETENWVCLIMEYIQGGELFYYIKKYIYFTDEIVLFYTAEIIAALKHLHSKDVLYRDLKAENVLIDDRGHAKLADFGFATQECDNIYTVCGTPEYMAPEKLMGNGDSKVTDYWALGCLIYEMYFGMPPYTGMGQLEIYDKILDGCLKVPRRIDPQALDLIRKLLITDRNKRLGANGIEEIMAHPFFKDIDWEGLFDSGLNPPIVPKLYQFIAPVDQSSAVLEEAPCRPKYNITHRYRRVYNRPNYKRRCLKF